MCSEPRAGLRRLAARGRHYHRAEREAVGAVAAYLAVRRAGHAASLNLLWALAAGLAGRHWDSLRGEEKRQLREELAAAER